MFRGSEAVRADLVTAGRLRGPHFARLFPDVYARAGAEPDLTLRSLAAYLYARRRGVLSGYSAAELLGASCAPLGVRPEITAPGRGVRDHPGLVLHRDALRGDEVLQHAHLAVTNHLRTAYDLARWCDDLVQAVVSVDALARCGGFAPEQVLRLADRYPRARHRRRLGRVVALADARAGSPMETRLRLLLVLGGLPAPQVQWVVQDERRRRAVWLDLAYPEHRVGIEYEGEEHLRPDRVLRDIGRGTDLVDQGWRLYRFTKREVFGEPAEIVAKIDRALRREVPPTVVRS